MEAVEKACDTRVPQKPRNHLASAQSRVAMRQVQGLIRRSKIGAPINQGP